MSLEAGKTYYLRGEIRSSGSKSRGISMIYLYLQSRAQRAGRDGCPRRRNGKQFGFPARMQKFGGRDHLKITLDQPSEPERSTRSDSLSSESDTAFSWCGDRLPNRVARVFFAESAANARRPCGMPAAKCGKNAETCCGDHYSGVRRTNSWTPALRSPPGGVEEIAFDRPVDRFGLVPD